MENVRFMGFRRDNANFFALADLYLVTSRIEGSPQTIAEAMAMGKTVLATPVGGVPELIKDGRNGYLIPANEPNEVAELIEQIHLGKKGKGVSAEARNTAENDFPIDSMKAGYRKLYQGLLKKGENETA